MGKSVLFTSGKGGTGKTACTAAVGSFLARSGRRTLCIDCDAALRNLDLTLGLAEAVDWDFMDIIRGDAAAADAVREHPDIPGLYFLSAPANLPLDASPGDFRALVDSVRSDYDFVLLDCPAGIDSGFRLAAAGADCAVIVATGDTSSLRDGQRTAQELRSLGVTELMLLVNRVRPRAYRRIRRTVDEIIDTVGARLLGIISEDDRVAEAGSLQVPLIKYGSRTAWYQFRNVAARLAGERIPLGRLRS